MIGKKRANPGVATTTAPETDYHIRCAKLVKGRVVVEYAVGKVIIEGDLARLRFSVRSVPSRSITGLFESYPLPVPTDFSVPNQWRADFLGGVYPSIRRVTGEIHLPCSLLSTPLVDAIKTFCQDRFPHARSDAASLTVHHPVEEVLVRFKASQIRLDGPDLGFSPIEGEVFTEGKRQRLGTIGQM